MILTAALVLALLPAWYFPGPAVSATEGEAAAVPPTLNDRFGVAQSHLMLYNTISPALIEANLDAMVDAGIGWVRCVFAWPDLEAIAGAWDFTHADRVVAEAGERGINILGIMLGSPGWANGGQAWNYPPTDHAAWTNYAATLSGRYRGEVAAWEIWNEENIHAFWQPAPDSAAYMVLLQEASGAIRSADPGATIVMGGMAGLGSDYLDECLSAGAADYLDALAYHPYPETLYKDDYTPQEERTSILVNDFVPWLISQYTTKHLEVWLTEFGWTTCTLVPPGVSEDNQAAYLLRSLLNYAATSADKVFYYDLWEEIDDTANPGYCYGLLHNDFTAKPAYHYYQRFEEVFGPAVSPSTAPLSYQCTTPGTLETRAYQPDAGTLAVAAWKSDGLGDSLSITLDCGPRYYLDPMRVDLATGARTAVPGVTRNPERDITATGLPVGNTPVILEFEAAPLPGITWCLAEGSTAGDMETWVLVQNPGAAAVSVDLTLQTGDGALAPEVLQNVNIPGASRVSFRLNDYCQTYDVSTLVSASGPVVAERATYGPGREWAQDSVGVALK